MRVGKAGSKSWDCYSWQSCLTHGASKKVKMYIFGLFEASKCKGTTAGLGPTMTECWKVTLDSFQAAYDGQFPDHEDRGGEDLAGGFFLVIWSLKGDLDYFAKGLLLRHYAANSFCEYCPAHSDLNDPPMLWNNFNDDDARWKVSLFDKEAWRGNHTILHPVFQQFAFLSQHNVEPDELHIMYLGTVQHIVGSILWLLCYRSLPGTPEENVVRVFKCICDYYTATNTATQYSNLGLSSFVDPSSARTEFPKLRGKGAEAKDIVAPLLHVWKTFHDHSSSDHQQVCALLEMQIEAQVILSESKDQTFLPKSAAIRFGTLINGILKVYSKLAVEANNRGDLLWNLTPKWHWLYHLGQKAVFINPRLVSCLVDEDFVGLLSVIVGASAQGSPMHKVPDKVAEQISWAMHFEACERQDC